AIAPYRDDMVNDHGIWEGRGMGHAPKGEAPRDKPHLHRGATVALPPLRIGARWDETHDRGSRLGTLRGLAHPLPEPTALRNGLTLGDVSARCAINDAMSSIFPWLYQDAPNRVPRPSREGTPATTPSPP